LRSVPYAPPQTVHEVVNFVVTWGQIHSDRKSESPPCLRKEREDKDGAPSGYGNDKLMISRL